MICFLFVCLRVQRRCELFDGVRISILRREGRRVEGRLLDPQAGRRREALPRRDEEGHGVELRPPRHDSRSTDVQGHGGRGTPRMRTGQETAAHQQTLRTFLKLGEILLFFSLP